jgi:hypothetical protein
MTRSDNSENTKVLLTFETTLQFEILTKNCMPKKFPASGFFR